MPAGHAGPVLLAAAILSFAVPCAAGVVTLPLAGAPAASRVYGVATSGNRVFISVGSVAGIYAHVFVWDAGAERYLADIDLALVADSPALRARAVTADASGGVWVGTAPFGELFRVDAALLTAVSKKRFPVFEGDTLTEIAALAVSGNSLYAGGAPMNDSGSAVLYRMSITDTAGGADTIALRKTLPDTNAVGVRSLLTDSTGQVFVGVSGLGETGALLFRVNGTAASFDTNLSSDSAIVAMGVHGDTLFYVAEPTGRVYARRLSTADSSPFSQVPGETTAFASGLALDTGLADSRALFFASDAATVFRTTGDPLAARFTVPTAVKVTALAGVTGIPARLYGGASNAGEIPFFWFYDVFSPSITRFTIRPAAPPLQQPTTPEDFPRPLTRGLYEVKIVFDERAARPPGVVSAFPGSGSETLAVTGAETSWTAFLLIREDEPPGEIVIRVTVSDTAGNETTTAPGEGTFANVSIGNIRIAQNRFRPGFGEFATIRILLTAPSPVRIRVYNFRGMHLRTVTDAPLPAGSHDIVWDGRGDAGQELGSGVYLIRVDAGGTSETHKAMLIR